MPTDYNDEYVPPAKRWIKSEPHPSQELKALREAEKALAASHAAWFAEGTEAIYEQRDAHALFEAALVAVRQALAAYAAAQSAHQHDAEFEAHHALASGLSAKAQQSAPSEQPTHGETLPEDSVHGKCAHWLRRFLFRHEREPFPQEVWDAALASQPAARVAPLTDEQIESGMDALSWRKGPAKSWFEAGVRYAERAHGITAPAAGEKP